MNTQRSCLHGFFTHGSYQPTMGLGVSIEYKSQTNQDRHIDELMDTQKANDIPNGSSPFTGVLLLAVRSQH